GDSILHDAVYGGNMDILELLLDKKVDLNGKNKKGESPLDIAIRVRRQNVEMLLRSFGAKAFLHD
ncbi:MAG: ankyrin repeat domain-containing protein, partial [Bdellovibrionales bacterium]|nr:ankyrin repeat domain-containing protein [Bdellovibrionales bacterium]